MTVKFQCVGTHNILGKHKVIFSSRNGDLDIEGVKTQVFTPGKWYTIWIDDDEQSGQFIQELTNHTR